MLLRLMEKAGRTQKPGQRGTQRSPKVRRIAKRVRHVGLSHIIHYLYDLPCNIATLTHLHNDMLRQIRVEERQTANKEENRAATPHVVDDDKRKYCVPQARVTCAGFDAV